MGIDVCEAFATAVRGNVPRATSYEQAEEIARVASRAMRRNCCKRKMLRAKNRERRAVILNAWVLRFTQEDVE